MIRKKFKTSNSKCVVMDNLSNYMSVFVCVMCRTVKINFVSLESSFWFKREVKLIMLLKSYPIESQFFKRLYNIANYRHLDNVKSIII